MAGVCEAPAGAAEGSPSRRCLPRGALSCAGRVRRGRRWRSLGGEAPKALGKALGGGGGEGGGIGEGPMRRESFILCHASRRTLAGSSSSSRLSLVHLWYRTACAAVLTSTGQEPLLPLERGARVSRRKHQTARKGGGVDAALPPGADPVGDPNHVRPTGAFLEPSWNLPVESATPIMCGPRRKASSPPLSVLAGWGSSATAE